MKKIFDYSGFSFLKYSTARETSPRIIKTIPNIKNKPKPSPSAPSLNLDCPAKIKKNNLDGYEFDHAVRWGRYWSADEIKNKFIPIPHISKTIPIIVFFIFPSENVNNFYYAISPYAALRE